MSNNKIKIKDENVEKESIDKAKHEEMMNWHEN